MLILLPPKVSNINIDRIKKLILIILVYHIFIIFTKISNGEG